MEKDLINIRMRSKSRNDYDLEIKKIGNFVRFSAINLILSFEYRSEINFDSELKKKYYSIENFLGKIINYIQRNEVTIDDDKNKINIDLIIKNLHITLKMIEKDDEDNNEINKFINKKKLNKDNNNNNQINNNNNNNQINNNNNNNINNNNQINNNNNNDNFIKEINNKYYQLLKKINENNESNLKKLNDYNNQHLEEIKYLKLENKKTFEDYQKFKIKYFEDTEDLKSQIERLENELTILTEKFIKIDSNNKDFKEFNSKIIIHKKNYDLILSYLPTNFLNKKLELIYRASTDGDSSESFHNHVDDTFFPTLIIALTTKNEIFGGFTKEFWDSSNKFKNDDESFIFDLSKKSKFISLKKKGGIFCNKKFGPNFGENGNAMFFNSHFFENENCGIGKNESFTNGEKTIRGKLKELEIYKFIEKN